MSERSFSFQIFFSLLGTGGGLGLVLLGLLSSPPVMQNFYQPRGLLILGGGLLAVTWMSFSPTELRQSLRLLWDVLSGASSPDCEGVLKESVMLASRSREAEGQEAKLYREIKPYLSHAMLRAGLDLLIAGYDAQMVKETLQTRQRQELMQYQTTEQVLKTCLQASWMLGLAGGLTAILRTQLLQNADTLQRYLSGIALPMALGLLLSMLLFYPLLRQVQLQRSQWQNYLDMNIAAVLLLQGRHHALFLETVLRAFLPVQTAVPAPPPRPAAAPVMAAAPAAGFQQALQQEQYPPAAEAPPADAGADGLSKEQLKRFRPVQPRKPQP
jgi:flagellar motor component MotA